MAKFKVEVDLDWMDSETTIDDEIKGNSWCKRLSLGKDN